MDTWKWNIILLIQKNYYSVSRKKLYVSYTFAIKILWTLDDLKHALIRQILRVFLLLYQMIKKKIFSMCFYNAIFYTVYCNSKNLKYSSTLHITVAFNISQPDNFMRYIFNTKCEILPHGFFHHVHNLMSSWGENFYEVCTQLLVWNFNFWIYFSMHT